MNEYISNKFKESLLRLSEEEDRAMLLGIKRTNNNAIDYSKAIEEEKRKAKCPACDSQNLKYGEKISYGHGDCGFYTWIRCNDCGISKSLVAYYGKPEHVDELKSWKKWNRDDSWKEYDDRYF